MQTLKAVHHVFSVERLDSGDFNVGLIGSTCTALPLGFFQLEIDGGIFQSLCSFVLMDRGGLCIIGTGGEPGPRGTFLQGLTLVDVSSQHLNLSRV